MERLTFVRDAPGGAIVDVVVQPRASRTSVAGRIGDALKIKVTAPPVDDQANRAVERALAKLLRVRPKDVTVLAGRSSRKKRLKVDGMTAAEASRALAPVLSSPAHEPGQKGKRRRAQVHGQEEEHARHQENGEQEDRV